MSDTSQGPGWWQASDGKWYPPEQAPGAQPAPAPASPSFGAPQTPSFGAPQYSPSASAGSYASWGQRVVAYLVDFGIMIGIVIVGAIFAAVLGAISDVLGLLVAFVLYVAAFAFGLYAIGFLNGTGGSPGKRLTGLRVVSVQTGQPIGGGMGIVRYFAHIVDGLICYIGYLFPLWDEKRQTLADKIVGTVVLTGQPKQAFGPDLFKP